MKKSCKHGALVIRCSVWYTGQSVLGIAGSILIKKGMVDMAELTIVEREVGDVTVLDLIGEITIGEGTVALRSLFRHFSERSQTRFVINLADVSYVDSAGVAELFASRAAVQNISGRVVLLNLANKIKDLLVITKLLTGFDAYLEEAEAVGSFA
jgi:anti-sigma B factor antagonist